MTKNDKNIFTRPPIVTILGHVDHGKCVSSDTLISLSNGKILTAEKLYELIENSGKKERVKGGYIVHSKKTYKTFGFDGKKVKVRPILAAWKLTSPKHMFEVELFSGDKITTTAEHLFFKFSSDGLVQEVRTDILSAEDYVIIPKNLKFSSNLEVVKKSILNRFIVSQNWVVFLNPEKSVQFIKMLTEYGREKLYRQNLLTTKFDNASRKALRLRAGDFVKTASFFKFSVKEIYSMISWIKNATPKWRAGHTSPKIRLPQTSQDFVQLGYILGCLMGDGYLPDGVLDNNDPEIHGVYSSYLENVFGIKTKVVQGHTCKRVITNGGESFNRFLIDILELPRTNKSATVSIPGIVQSDQEIIKAVIEGWFDTDGYVSKINNCIEWTSKSSLLIRQAGFYLLQFGIHSVIYKKNNYWYLRIANKPYVELFYNSFYPRLTYKRERIKEAINKSSTSRTFDLTPVSGKILKDVNISNEKLPFFDRYKVSSGLSRPFIRKMLSLGLINPSAEFRAVVNTQVSPVKIKSIVKTTEKEKWVYDFTVEEVHNFVANRIFVHNTTLLDTIRKTRVALKEAGGITQAIGASEVVTKEGKRITFIDTPGHAAFKEMRSRGAKVADIAILVVAADDGVQPQTKEALAFIKEAEIPFIVAVTKVDLATANVEATLGQLEKEGIFFEKRGGEVPWVAVSAKTGIGMEELINLISLLAEVGGINGNPEAELEAVVIETSIGKGGNLVSAVVRNGSIVVGEILYFEGGSAKVRNLLSDYGPVKKIMPGEPVQILGFEVLPPVGSKLFSTVFDDQAEHLKKESVGKLAKGEIGVFIKAGNAGSLEAVLGGMPTGITVIGSSVGDIFESDVLNAKSSSADYIFAFETGVSSNVSKLAEAEGIKISSFKIIYELFQALEELVKKGKVVVLGKAEIVGAFPFNNRRVAGAKVITGRIGKTDKLILMRGDKELGTIKVVSMKKQKQEITLAGQGEEFGMLFEPQFDFTKGDVILSVTNNG